MSTGPWPPTPGSGSGRRKQVRTPARPPGPGRSRPRSRRDSDTSAALRAANRAYEDRFGRVFLICATGLSADEVLAELHWRLSNDEASEAAVVAEELRKIALLRLRKVLDR